MTTYAVTLRWRPAERACYLIAACLVVAGLAHLVVAGIDPRPWLGPLSWRKPITFGLSFGTVLASVTWVTSYLRIGWRTRAWILGVFAADCVVEVAGISVQAWRDVPSHFNTSTPFDSVVAFTLAAGGAVLFATLGTFAVVALRGRIDAASSMRLALRAGFALLVAGLLSGAAMIVRGEELMASGPASVAYDTAGFLKTVHGITLHGVLVLPALAWLLGRTDRTERERTRIVGCAIGVYVAAAVLALVVSLARL